ncbi:helix-turn-helix domain-containing protein [Martelella alba]|uniref:Helix-turn-helix domain-containing protein n=1 Tax=Martelella alba TaxID=2590451 RepID=A0A506U1E8_9HYPH|nr:helix-turn-helix domain-containing protein [Martelella alba]TPW27328.1 helix-turn-helix domain-containing protein [Martelella alba]
MSLGFQTEPGNPAHHDYWREMVCRHHIKIAPQFDSQIGFRGQMRIDDWGPVQLSDASFTPITYMHGVDEIRQSDRDDFLCVVNLDGDGAFQRNSQSIAYKAGDLLLYDTNQVYALNFPTAARTISARIPRALITSRLPEADRQFALCLRGDRPTTQLAVSMLKNAATLSELPDEGSCREMGHSLLDIVCIAVKDNLGATLVPTPGQAAVLKRIKLSLLEQLGDASLDIETIAQAQGLSSRTLNRMFASEGTTVMRWLWKQRLAASYRALSDGSVRQVTEAAFRFGFKDSSHYTRAFKREYNLQPNKLIAR